jgi:cobalt-precorrin-5B (C1)-methyltransferase
MTLARELWERIAEEGKTVFARTVIRHCYEHCAPLLPNGELLILLIDDKGKIYEG